jgi:putative oxidoreductase
MRTVKTVLVWGLQILLGLLFVLLGVMKFQDPSWARNFARWGYPDGFYMIVGVLEAAGGIGLLIPRLTSYAAALLVAVMAAAGLTHLVHGEMQRLSAPVVYLLLIAMVGWRRRASAWRPAQRRSMSSEAVL